MEENQTFSGTQWFTTPMMVTSNSTNMTSPLSVNFTSKNSDDPLKRINIKYITISVITVVANLLIILLVTTSRENRRKTFLWHILGLSVWYLFFGIFAIPLMLDYKSGFVWRHGVVVCRMITVSQFCNFSLCSLILVCASVDRMLAKVQLITHINERLTKVLNFMLVFMPWTLVITVTLPLVLTSEMKYEDQGIDWCTMKIDDTYFVRTIALLYITPLSILGLVMFILILLYILTGDNRKCMLSEATEEEIASLRMSTVATWLASILFFVSWVPAVSTWAISAFHNKNSCLLQYESSLVVEAFYESTGATIPFVWLLLVEIRASFKSWMKIIRNSICRRNFSQMNNPFGWVNRNEQSDF